MVKQLKISQLQNTLYESGIPWLLHHLIWKLLFSFLKQPKCKLFFPNYNFVRNFVILLSKVDLNTKYCDLL